MKAPDYWYGGSVPLYARLLAAVYGAAIALRMWLFRLRLLPCFCIDRPVLVIGNLTTGGSGKTPLVIATVQRLQAAGWTPGVATRGYGRSDAGTPRWVARDTDPLLGGDEPVLIAARTGARVRADADRVAAARALIDAGCDVVVCDDGLQHYRLQRDIEIEVIDGRRRHGNGRLLPAGPLRETPARAARCDFHVLNIGDGDHQSKGDHECDERDDGPATRFGEWPMHLAAGHAVPLHGGRPLALTAFIDQRVHAVAGIGNPERFFATLRAAGLTIVPHAFADHYRFVADDLVFGSDLPVLMTEKDAVKCRAFAGERHYSVPVDAELPEAFWVALMDRIAQVTKSGDGRPKS